MTIADFKKVSGKKAGARNACRLCTPLGACMVFAGIEGCVPFLHGSQGCATYIRRYMISHFREPVDIASSSFSEEEAVFGGSDTLKAGLANVEAQYSPQCIGVATTCLSETIGEDVTGIIDEYCAARQGAEIPLLDVSTAAYRGTHVTGFNDTIKAVLQCLVEPDTPSTHTVNLLPGMMSAEDLRYLKQLCASFEISAMILPDYSETLDGGSWEQYQRMQKGGTPLSAIRACAAAGATIELGATLENDQSTAGHWLSESFGVPCYSMGLPIGIRATDRFLQILVALSGKSIPENFTSERARLTDSYVDGHKYLAGKRALVFGDPDLVVGISGFLAETGVIPVLCASGTKNPHFHKAVNECVSISLGEPEILNGADHETIRRVAREIEPDFLIGSSKGYAMARELNVPLIRVGFPIHDRIGAQRLLHLGYSGAQRLYDLITNTLLDYRQTNNETAWSYL